MATSEIISQLRQARRAAGYTQNRLADEAGYSRHVVQKSELGHNSPSIDAVEACAGVLNLQVHLGPPDVVAALVASSLARIDEYVEARARELSHKQVLAAHKEAADRIAATQREAVARAEKSIKDDRDYWKAEALKARALLGGPA